METNPALDALIAASSAATETKGRDESDGDTSVDQDKSNESKSSDDEKQDEDETNTEEIDVSFRSNNSSKGSVIVDMNPNEHARVNDPILRPVKKQPKREQNYPFGGNIGTEAEDTNATQGSASVEYSDSILSRLFEPDRKQKRELWEFVRLVAPGPINCPPPGQYKWRSKDAVAAYCLKCKRAFTYTPGTSKTVSRHLIAHHGLSEASVSKVKKRQLKLPTSRATETFLHDNPSDTEERLDIPKIPKGKPSSAPRQSISKRRKTLRSGDEKEPVDFRLGERESSKSNIEEQKSGSRRTNANVSKALFRWMIGSYQMPGSSTSDIFFDNSSSSDRGGFLSSSSLFTNFCQTLDDSFEMPSRSVMETLATRTYEKLCNEIHLHSRKLFPASSTSDTDEYSINHHEFISVSVRQVRMMQVFGRGATNAQAKILEFYPVRIKFCTPMFRPKSYVIAVIQGIEKDDDKDSDILSPYFNAVDVALTRYGLPLENVTRIVIRGESNNDSFHDDEQQKRAGFAGLEKRECLCLLERMDRIIFKALRSSAGASTFIRKKLFGWNDEGELEYPMESETCGVLYKRLLSLSTSDTDSQSRMANLVLETIKPLHDAIETLSQDPHPTVGLAIPILRRVRDLIRRRESFGNSPSDEDLCVSEGDNDATFPQVSSMIHDSIVKDFTETFSLFLQSNPPLMWTMLLDPRLIAMRGLSAEEQQIAKSMLIEEVTQVVHIIDQSEGGPNEATEDMKPTSTDTKSTPTNTMGGIFWGEELDQGGDRRGLSVPSIHRDADEYSKLNVESYINAVQSQRQARNPLLWWKNNQQQFPELAMLARKWICSSTIFGGLHSQDNEVAQPIPTRERDLEKLKRMIFLHENRNLF